MPYVNEETRNLHGDKFVPIESHVDSLIAHLREITDEDNIAGILNYTISRIVAGAGKPDGGWRYGSLSRAHEVFHAAGSEFYRRLIAPYEDKAREKNGDIPEYQDAFEDTTPN